MPEVSLKDIMKGYYGAQKLKKPNNKSDVLKVDPKLLLSQIMISEKDIKKSLHLSNSS